jgi:hypothetical protein
VRRVTPIALLLAAVFLTSAATAYVMPVPAGSTGPNVTIFWAVGVLSLVVWFASLTSWIRARTCPWQPQLFKLLRLQERGVQLQKEYEALPKNGAAAVVVSADFRSRLIAWSNACQKFADGLFEPTYSPGLPEDSSIAANGSGAVFHLFVKHYIDQRLDKLSGSLVEPARHADKL